MKASLFDIQQLAKEHAFSDENIKSLTINELKTLLKQHLQNDPCSCHISSPVEIPCHDTSSSFPPKKQHLSDKHTQYKLFDTLLKDKLQYWICSVCVERSYSNDNQYWIPINYLSEFSEFQVSDHIPYYAPKGPSEASNLLVYSGSIIKENQILVCKSCHKSLASRHIPKFSLSYPYNWLAPLPASNNPSFDIIQSMRQRISQITSTDLPILSMAENDLVSRQRIAVSILRLQTINKHDAHYVLRGNSLFFPQYPANLLKKLPPPLDIIQKTFVVVIEPHKNDLDIRTLLTTFKAVRVRREVIRIWIEWLIFHNPLYKDCEISLENLSDIPEDGPIPIDPILQESRNCTLADYNWAQGTEEGGGQHGGPSVTSFPDHQIPAADVAAISLNPIQFTSPEEILKAVSDVLEHGQGFMRITRGTELASLLDSENIMMSFPYLFPHATGFHIEPDKKYWPNILFHLQHHHDSRFRKDSRFTLLTFSILQRMHMYLHSKLCIDRKGFYQWKELFDAGEHVNINEVISLLTMQKENPTNSDEIQHRLQNNPYVRRFINLTNQISQSAQNIPWSPSAKQRRRQEIQAMMLMYGLPMYFITLAPNDIWNPLTLQKVKDDEATIDGTPDMPHCMKNPTACAQGFWEYITLYFEVVLGWKDGKPIKNRTSIFGKVSAYYGTIESQGNGGLHLHLLIWIADVPRPHILVDKVNNNEDYHNTFIPYINDMMSVQINDPDTKDQDSIKELMRLHPVKINASDEEVKNFNQRFAKNLNVHWFHNTSCFKYDKTKTICRFFRDGFFDACSETKFINSTLLIERQDGWGRATNSYNPLTAYLFRLNNDIKFIYCGNDITGLAFYITDYITKRSMPMHDILSLIRKVLELKQDCVQDIQLNNDDAQYAGKRLLLSLMVNMTSKQEIAAPMASLFLTGKQDFVTTSRFRRIPLYSLYEYINTSCPASFKLNLYSKLSSPNEQSEETDESNSIPLEQDSYGNGLTSHDSVELDGTTMMSDFATLCDDYRFRPRSLDSETLYQFFSKYEKRPLKSGSHPLIFLQDHPQVTTHGIIKRRAQTIILPILFPIPPFHVFDDTTDSERYARFLLICFRPWRTVLDLIQTYQTWTLAVNNINETFDPIAQILIENMQDIAISRQAKLQTIQERNSSQMISVTHFSNIGQALEVSGAFENYIDDSADISYFHEDRYKEKDLEVIAIAAGYGLFTSSIQLNQHISRLQYHATQEKGWLRYQALVYSNHFGVPQTDTEFNQDVDEDQNIILNDDLNPNENNRMQQRIEFSYFNDQVSLDSLPSSPTSSIPTSLIDTTDIPDIDLLDTDNWYTKFSDLDILNKNINLFTLNYKQTCVLRRIYTAIQEQNQLLLYVGGSGGTGKSRVIQCIQSYFKDCNAENNLVTMAPTGVAASLIRGSTCASLLWGASRTICTPKISQTKKQYWKNKHFILIDEVSMIGCQSLVSIDLYLRSLKKDKLFGGLHVIFFGDFAQLPPVGIFPLYDGRVEQYTVNPDDGYIQGSPKTQIMALGAALWQKVNEVIILTEIRRQSDTRYIKFLERLRWGRCTQNDIEMLNTRYILNHPELLTNNSSWDTAPLITQNRSTRDAWNDSRCKNATKYYSIDHIQENTVEYKNTAKAHHLIQTTPARLCRDQDDISGCLSLFIGQRIMILKNLCVPLGIVNGATAIIEEIRTKPHPNPRYEFHATGLIVKLINPPLNATNYEGLSNGTVYIPTIKFQTYVNYHPLYTHAKVTRQQLPIIPAYALTDYKSQGSTLDRAILNLPIPSRTLGRFSSKCQHLYVMFSRVKSLDSLLLLQKVNMSFFSQLRSDCRQEIKRLVQKDPDLPDEFRSLHSTNQSDISSKPIKSHTISSKSHTSTQKQQFHSIHNLLPTPPLTSQHSNISVYTDAIQGTSMSSQPLTPSTTILHPKAVQLPEIKILRKRKRPSTSMYTIPSIDPTSSTPRLFNNQPSPQSTISHRYIRPITNTSSFVSVDIPITSMSQRHDYVFIPRLRSTFPIRSQSQQPLPLSSGVSINSPHVNNTPLHLINTPQNNEDDSE